ncbi:hypothetical protein EYC59_00055 [Candidatus Saccharibacteria bacterium]|nr:MAG: hypothetical protein EYC59_00055 [Candidatus Saccharibacteria bacterium]
MTRRETVKINLNKLSLSKTFLPILFVGMFGLIGLTVLISTHAATQTANFEAENGTKSGNATTVTDASASGGSAIKFASSGQVSACTGTAPSTYAYNPMNGRSWPTTYGQSYIATWKDDKIAATTLTIDDNVVADHAFWKQKAQETGFKFTWFVVTGQDSNGKLMTGATWDDFRALYALGHSIQSHTVTHSSPVTTAEMQQSQIDIQRGIGVKPVTIAYPDGDTANEAGAALYYIAGRSTVGWLNPYKPSDYMAVNSLSDYMNTDSPNNYNYAPAILDKSFTQDSGTDFYRGWMSIHYHSIAGDETNVQNHLNWLKAREADIWIAGFDHVAAYARERDVAALSVAAAGTNCVAFTVTDDLNNTDYSEPLTVKVRLQDSGNWPNVSAQQNGKAVSAKIVTNGSNVYALVDAVPDAGPVTVYNPSFN